jgi:hypothetical protein
MVRYADKPTVELSIEVLAPTAVVWDLVTDINLPAQFSTEFQGATWIDDDGPRLGARFIGRNRHRAVATRLTMWAEIGPGPSGLTPLIEKYPEREEEIVANRLVEWHSNMEVTLAGIKAVAEGG